MAVRKDHGAPVGVIRRGDALQIMLIQVKGGRAAMPTLDDAARLRAVAKRHGACGVLLATWKKGKEARFFRLRRVSATDWIDPWIPVTDLDSIFSMTCQGASVRTDSQSAANRRSVIH